MKLLAVLVLAIIILFLVRRNLLQVDLSFPLFGGLIVLGFASLSNRFIYWVAAKLGFVEAPFAIVMLIIGILIGITTALSIALSRIRQRQLMLVRHVARLELSQQELTRRPAAGPGG